MLKKKKSSFSLKEMRWFCGLYSYTAPTYDQNGTWNKEGELKFEQILFTLYVKNEK